MKLYKELAEYYFAIEANHRNILYDIHLISTHLKKYSEPSKPMPSRMRSWVNSLAVMVT